MHLSILFICLCATIMARPAVSLEKRQTAAEVSAAAAAYGIPEELLWGMIALGESHCGS